jgi:hypothetical protein
LPTYTFKNLETGELEEHVMKMSELDQFKIDNPQLERALVDAPSFGDPVRLGLRKNDAGWKETLARVAEKTPGGKVLKDSIR